MKYLNKGSKLVMLLSCIQCIDCFDMRTIECSLFCIQCIDCFDMSAIECSLFCIQYIDCFDIPWKLVYFVHNVSTASTCVPLNVVYFVSTSSTCFNSINIYRIWLESPGSQHSKTFFGLKIRSILRKLWAETCVSTVST